MMYAEQFAITFEGREADPYFQFHFRFLAALEQARTWVLTDHLLSVIQNRGSLKHLVEGMEQTEAKEFLSDVLEYDERYYSIVVASLIPFLNEFD